MTGILKSISAIVPSMSDDSRFGVTPICEYTPNDVAKKICRRNVRTERGKNEPIEFEMFVFENVVMFPVPTCTLDTWLIAASPKIQRTSRADHSFTMFPMNAASVIMNEPPAFAGEKSVVEFGAVNEVTRRIEIHTRPANVAIVEPIRLASINTTGPTEGAFAPSDESAMLSAKIVVVLSLIVPTSLKFPVLPETVR